MFVADQVEALRSNHLELAKLLAKGHVAASSIVSVAVEFLDATLRLLVHRSILDADLRLKLAIHLSPPTAVDYKKTNPLSRQKLIARHLAEVLELDEAEVESLARELARTLKLRGEKRVPIPRYESDLLNRDGDSCNACHIKFEDERARSVVSEDPMKPYYGADPSGPMFVSEIDHIVPISMFGTNHLDNLQLLCKLCNRGKSDGRPPTPQNEYRYCNKKLDDIPWKHRAGLTYFTLEHANFACEECGTRVAELTARKVHEDGNLILSNLRSVCYPCLDASSEK